MSRSADSQRAALRAFIKKNELKIRPWSKDAKVADGTLRNFLEGRSNTITMNSLEKLARAANATVAEMIGQPVQHSKLAKDVIAIKRLDVRASMGGGVNVSEEAELEPIYFRRDWIDTILKKEPGQLRALDLEGDSNLPTLNDGDLGLFLLSAKFEPGRFYAIWDGQGLIVKRLERIIGPTSKLRIISDNSAVWQPYNVNEEDVIIIAKLIWRGGPV